MDKPADAIDYPSFDDERAQAAARFLHVVDRIDHDKGELIRARIRGIDDLATLNAWRAVERRHYGRTEVLELLDERERELDAIGERPDRLDPGSREPSAVDKHVVIVDEDGAERTSRTSAAERSLLDYRDHGDVDDEDEHAVATDGGGSA